MGKWNIGHFEEAYLPHKRGFDSALSFQSDEMHYYNHTVEPRLQGFAPIDLLVGAAGKPYKLASDWDGYSSEIFANRAIAEIMNIDVTSEDMSPLFLYVAFQAVHVPHDIPPAILFDDDNDGWILENVTGNSDDKPYREHFAKTLVAMDRSVKRIMDAIETNGMMDTTIFAVASDNGGCPSDGSNNHPLRGGKFDLFEGGVNVPAFLYGNILPSSVRGTSFWEAFHVTDWLPTLVKLADNGKTLDDDLDGVSQLESLFEGTARQGARQETLLGLNRWYVTDSMTIVDLAFEEAAGAVVFNNYKYIQNQVARGWYSPLSHAARNCSCGVKTTPKTSFLFDIGD